MSKIYKDPCSFSNPYYYRQTHLSLDWYVDFEKRILSGHSILVLELNQNNNNKNENKLITLDTKDLLIKRVVEENSNTNLEFELGKTHSELGTPLNIKLNNLPDEPKSIKLLIEYETSPNASALQWLDSSATLGKRHPYLFSQCQAIHARSIVPLQDTPLVKFTYDASVTVPKPLVALMSAISVGSSDLDSKRVQFKFEQKVRIASYLIALSVGDLVSRQIGPITKVWTEKEMIEIAAQEFDQVTDMIRDAENLLGKYVWGPYDLLVLPPTFPFGGMENPCLTFVTPTIIAKDKSLVDVVQHEITHSWTGNLVTTSSWEHFWLNEGFTKFIERKLVAMFKKSELYRQFECIDGWRVLKEEVKKFGPTNEFTKLVVNLENTNPDDAFSSIPYEKGHMLLYYLEEKLGGIEIFNKYLRAHIERFKDTSLDTDDWKNFLYEYFQDKKDILDEIDWDTWLYKPGMPPVTLKFDQTLAEQVNKLSEKVLNEEIKGIEPLFNEFHSSQKREFLSLLLDNEPLSHAKLNSLNEFYKFGTTENAEILFRWIRIGIKAKWKPIIQPALKFVTDQGRMKFTRPVYRDLNGWEEVRTLVIENFQSQRQFMHQTTATLVAKDLGL